MAVSTLLILIVIGLLTGVVAGTLGVGGAIIMVPAMVFILGMAQHDAQGTSLMVIPVSIFAAFSYYRAGHVNIKFALVLATCFLVGSYFGSKFALTLPAPTLRKIFAVLLLVVAVKMLLSK